MFFIEQGECVKTRSENFGDSIFSVELLCKAFQRQKKKIVAIDRESKSRFFVTRPDFDANPQPFAVSTARLWQKDFGVYIFHCSHPSPSVISNPFFSLIPRLPPVCAKFFTISFLAVALLLSPPLHNLSYLFHLLPICEFFLLWLLNLYMKFFSPSSFYL